MNRDRIHWYYFHSWTEILNGQKRRFWTVHRSPYDKQEFIDALIAKAKEEGQDIKLRQDNLLCCYVYDRFAEKYRKNLEKFKGAKVYGSIHTDHCGTRTFIERYKDFFKTEP